MTTDNKLEDAAKDKKIELNVSFFPSKELTEQDMAFAIIEALRVLDKDSYSIIAPVTPPTSIREGEDRITDFLNKLKEDPYPEDVFLPVSKEELLSIHEMLKKEFNMPLDRLTGHIGRILRKPLMEQAKALLSSKEKPVENFKNQKQETHDPVSEDKIWEAAREEYLPSNVAPSEMNTMYKQFKYSNLKGYKAALKTNH